MVAMNPRTTKKHHYTLNMRTLCPQKWEHAHYCWGDELSCPNGIQRWEESLPNRETYIDIKDRVAIYTTAYDGARDREMEGGPVLVSAKELLAARVGTWLVPTDWGSSYKLCSTKAEALEAVLSLADCIWEDCGQAPGVEAIRLERKYTEEGEPFPTLRLYHFWFASEGHDPYVDADVIEEAYGEYDLCDF